MLYNFYEFVHNSIGVHFWDLPALLVTVILVIVLIVHSRNQKKRENSFEEARKEKLEALGKEAEGKSVKA